MPGQQRNIQRTMRRWPRTDPSPAARRLGYALAALINGVLIVIVRNIGEWDWLPFLTEEFEDVVPIITLSLAASAVGNLAFIVYDRPWFKAATQMAAAVVSLVATVRVFQVFPFDFSVYDFDWDTVARGILIVAIVGTAISVVVELTKLVRHVFRGEPG